MNNSFIILFAFLLLSYTKAQAQFIVGVESGVNVSKSSDSPVVNLDSSFRIGEIHYFCFTISPQYRLSEKLNFVTDLEFQRKGYALNFTDFTNRLSYLTAVPKIEYYPIKYIGLGVGPYMSYLLKDEAGEAENLSRISGQDPINLLDFGVELSVKGGYKNFFLSIAYQNGLSDASGVEFTDNAGVNLDHIKIQNRTFQFGIGYLIRL